MFQRHNRARFHASSEACQSTVRTIILATGSAVALMCSQAALAQSTEPSTQVPAGPTGAAQDKNGANPTSAPTPQSSADATTPSGGNEIVVTGTRAAGR